MASVIADFDHCYRAVGSRDARFDGWFFTAVTSTGIYCRPSCPAKTPKPENVRFYLTAAAAQQAGFRACMRCRPDAAPGSPEWLGRADVAARAVRLILDGAVDRDGVAGLARRLGYSERQLHRVLIGRGRHRRPLARPGPTRPDRPDPPPDDRPPDHPGRPQRRILQPPPVQRDDPRDLRPDSDRPPPTGLARPRAPRRPGHSRPRAPGRPGASDDVPVDRRPSGPPAAVRRRPAVRLPRRPGSRRDRVLRRDHLPAEPPPPARQRDGLPGSGS